MQDTKPDSLLPLQPAVFHILIALADRDRHGYSIMQDVASRTDGKVQLSAGTLYSSIRRMLDQGLIEELKDRDIWVVGTSAEAETDYVDWDWTRPTALVLGSEGSGLHRLVAENCDVLVKIPMYGKIESLNVSVAAGVILFEARRQRTTDYDRRTSD